MSAIPNLAWQQFRRMLICAATMLVATIAIAEDAPPSKATVAPSQSPAARSVSKDASKFQFKLGAQELNAVIAQHLTNASGNYSTELEGVVVLQQDELLPMRSPTSEVWGGIAAPVWAILHPTQAWRIFAPSSND